MRQRQEEVGEQRERSLQDPLRALMFVDGHRVITLCRADRAPLESSV